MTDPWDSAAARVAADQAAQERAQRVARAEKAAQAAREQAAADTAERALQAAIAQAVPALTQFLAKRGPAAYRLLAAHKNAYITLGSEYQGGGSQYSVYIDWTGLRYEAGTGSSYSYTPACQRAATVWEAVEAFARHGAGGRKPEQVRTIVEWLTAQIEAYAPADNRIPAITQKTSRVRVIAGRFLSRDSAMFLLRTA